MKTIYTFLAVLFSMTTFAQSGNQLAFFGGGNYQPILKGHQLGFDLTGRYYVKENLSLGFEFAYTSQEYREGFGYETDRTLMHNVILNSVIQYDFLTNEKFFIGAFLANGASIITLRDRNDTKTKEVYVDEWGTTEVEVPKRLGRDSFYILTSGVDFSFKVANLNEEFNTNLYITSRIGYQKAFGNQDFSRPENFSDFVFSLGVTIRGNL